MNILIEQAQRANEITDHTATPSFTESALPAAGLTTARFIGYIEMGQRETSYQGKITGKAIKAKLIFELNGKRHRQKDEDGNEYGMLYYQDVFVKTGDKANFKKLFRAMSAGRDSIKHMAQMLNEAFLLEITHNKVDENKTYANMTSQDGAWTIRAPVVMDPETEEPRHVKVPEATYPLRLLLWDKPTKEQWDSIFIDGTYTKKDEDGNETQHSKNWMQEIIVNEALDYEGSPLETLLRGADLNQPLVDTEPATETPQNASADAPDPAPATEAPDNNPATTAAPESASEPEQKSSAQEVDDILKDLGL